MWRNIGMAKTKHSVQLKRVYEPASPADGTRILVERLWPRGVSKAKAAIDTWAKDLAPSPELRAWYSHDLARWDEFCQRYRAELEHQKPLLADVKTQLRSGPVTFVFATKDEAHSSALILKEFLEHHS
jgi:uncharacterized protein YeaO (DUF488 family)